MDLVQTLPKIKEFNGRGEEDTHKCKLAVQALLLQFNLFSCSLRIQVWSHCCLQTKACSEDVRSEGFSIRQVTISSLF